MSDLKLTISGSNAEELLSNLIAAANAMSAGAGFMLVGNGNIKSFDGSAADASVKEDPIAKETSPQTEPAATVPSGRRGGRGKAAEKTPEAEPKSRRSRGAAKKDDLVNDNEEQAALRAQLIVDLQDLADVEEAHGEVQEALHGVGAKSVKEVASASLGDFDAHIQPLIAKYFE